jgi:hypothetical protein
MTDEPDHDFTPLDPNEGPTAWAQVIESHTAEKAHVNIVTGVDPTDPMDDVLLNASEFETVISLYRAMIPDE